MFYNPQDLNGEHKKNYCVYPVSNKFSAHSTETYQNYKPTKNPIPFYNQCNATAGINLFLHTQHKHDPALMFI